MSLPENFSDRVPKYVATGSDEGLVCLWDIASGRRLAEIAGSQNYVLSLSFSPDGKRLAAAS